MTPPQETLVRQGFANFYRHSGKWTGNEHIHAIYGGLKMKPQLEEQVRQFLEQRQARGLARLG